MTGKKIGRRHPDRIHRARLGFPKREQLVFYTDPQDASTKTDILEWSIVEESDKGYTLVSVTTKDRVYPRLHSGIVAFMQRPDFIEENTRELWNKKLV